MKWQNLRDRNPSQGLAMAKIKPGTTQAIGPLSPPGMYEPTPLASMMMGNLGTSPSPRRMAKQTKANMLSKTKKKARSLSLKGK